MAQAAEKILSTLAPHLRTVGVALRGAGASLMAYAPPAAADVGAQLEAMITDPVYEGKSLAGLIDLDDIGRDDGLC